MKKKIVPLSWVAMYLIQQCQFRAWQMAGRKFDWKIKYGTLYTNIPFGICPITNSDRKPFQGVDMRLYEFIIDEYRFELFRRFTY